MTLRLEDNRRPDGPRVLDGVRVLDFTTVISGPYATRMMADLGAEVLKIEPPGGELMRHAPPLRAGISALYSHLNSGKRSLVLDLKQAAAVAVVLDLVADCDVVVENFSPGVMRRLGLEYATLAARRPDLVMCSISGFGQAGPDAHKPAYAPVVQAWSGFDRVTLGYQPGLSTPLNMGLPVADTSAALQAFGAIASALFYRSRTGQGQYIDISMYDTLLATMHKDFQQMLNPDGRERRYGPLRTRDGFVLVILLSSRHFEALADCIGQPALKADPRFATTPQRLFYYQDLMAITEAWTADQSTAAVVTMLEAVGVPIAPYRELADALHDAQLAYRGMLTEVHDAAGSLIVPNTPFLFSRTQASVQPWVARLGEHGPAVLAARGYSAERIAALVDAGALGVPTA